MEKLSIGRRDFLKMGSLIVASAALNACSKKDLELSTPATTPSIQPMATELSPTATETNITPKIEPTKTIVERFTLGSFNVGSTPFEVEMPMAIMEPMGYTKTRKMELHKPLQVLVDYVPFIGDGGVGDQFHSEGWGVGKVFLTERQNIIMIEAHSESINALGEVARIIGSWVRKNPGQEEKIYGQNIIITPEGLAPINAELVFVKTATKEEYEDHVFWGIYTKRENIILFNTKTAGIPDEIRSDKTPGVYYLIIASCMPQGGAPTNMNPLDKNRYNFNTAERAIVVFKIQENSISN